MLKIISCGFLSEKCLPLDLIWGSREQGFLPQTKRRNGTYPSFFDENRHLIDKKKKGLIIRIGDIIVFKRMIYIENKVLPAIKDRLFSELKGGVVVSDKAFRGGIEYKDPRYMLREEFSEFVRGVIEESFDYGVSCSFSNAWNTGVAVKGYLSVEYTLVVPSEFIVTDASNLEKILNSDDCLDLIDYGIFSPGNEDEVVFLGRVPKQFVSRIEIIKDDGSETIYKKEDN